MLPEPLVFAYRLGPQCYHRLVKRLMKSKQNQTALALQSPPEESSKSKPDPLARVIKAARQVTGLRTDEAADRAIVQVAGSCVWPRAKDGNEQILKAFSAIAEISPANYLETMLATQMIAANDAALLFLHYATLPEQSFAGRDANVVRATRLMRLFCEQLEALQKLKGKTGQQRVTVEHVHVNQGGQAIVGAVTTAIRGDVGNKDENKGKTP